MSDQTCTLPNTQIDNINRTASCDLYVELVQIVDSCKMAGQSFTLGMSTCNIERYGSFDIEQCIKYRFLKNNNNIKKFTLTAKCDLLSWNMLMDC